MTKLKNIIFDLGGVLIDLDFSKTTKAFQDLGFPHFEKMYSQFKVDQLFEKLETGAITQEEFYKVMVKVADDNITAEQVKFSWNSLLLDFRKESLDFLKELAKKYNLFLLSNTNIIHYEAFNTILKDQTSLDLLDPLFTKCYYSHFIGLRKPNKNIFDFVLEDAGLKAMETLFIDDTRDNILAAAELGFRTHLLLPGEKIELLEYD